MIESPESASPLVTRAVAAALKDQFHTTYSPLPWQRPVLRLLGYLPQQVARGIITRFQAFSGLDPKLLEEFDLEKIAQVRLDDYRQMDGQFDTITIGPALGGVSAHISLSMRSLFLPISFVFTLRGGSPSGNAHIYFRRSAKLALEIANNNPELVTIQHYDPIHDGWLTGYVNHLRVKLIDLPAVYRQFISRHLKRGGTICYLESAAQWLRYRVGERSYFQVGGWGDLNPEEFLQGSPRINRYREDSGFTDPDWQLPGFQAEAGAESEWGCEPPLAQSLEQFCLQNGYNLIKVVQSTPHEYSRLAYQAVSRQLDLDSRPPAGILVEMFSQFDASSVILSGLLPVWLVFNTWDSLAYLRDMFQDIPTDLPLFFSPLVTFSLTPDLVPWADWQFALKDFNWINIGTRPSHYPADTRALLDWQKPLWHWVQNHRSPIRSVLTPNDVKDLAAGSKPGNHSIH